MPDTSHLQHAACVMITNTCISLMQRDQRFQDLSANLDATLHAS